MDNNPFFSDADNPFTLCPQTPKRQDNTYGDRFIPTRKAPSDTPEHPFEDKTAESIEFEKRLYNYTSKLTPESIINPESKRLLFFGSPQSKFIHNQVEPSLLVKKPTKPLPKVSIETMRVLDAPNVNPNFYTNVLAWSRSERVSIALNYPEGGKIFSVSPNHPQFSQTVTSSHPVRHQQAYVIAALDEENIVSGWNDGFIRLHRSGEDCGYHYANRSNSKPIHSIAVINPKTIIYGDAYNSLKQVDFRIATAARNQTNSSRLSSEQNQIPGLAYDGHFHLASGSNNNTVNLWDIRNLSRGEIQTNTVHKAGIKALAFWPQSKQYLISGGGAACRSLSLWNTKTDEIKHTLDTGSQITGIHCFKNDPRYFTTSHGYSDFSIKLWRISNHTFSLQSSHNLGSKNQNNRTLCLTGSPNTNDFATVTDSETLQFFKPHGLNDSCPLKKTLLQPPGLPPELTSGPVMR